MANAPALNRDDSAWVNERLHALAADHAEKGHVDLKAVIPHELVGELADAVAKGEQGSATMEEKEAATTARRVLRGCAEIGVRTALGKVLKRARGTVYVPKLRSTVVIPNFYGIRTMKRNGKSRIVYQQSLWWKLPWDLVTRLFSDTQAQNATLEVRLAAFSEVLKLREEYPDSATPEEACRLKGIDPQSFQLSP